MEDPRTWTREEFEAAIVGQHDDEDYSESGYVACVRDGAAYLAQYSHCSCDGTFVVLSGYGSKLSWNWIGTPAELVAMAQRNADPDMPARTANLEDSDYDHLQEVYKQVLAWSEPKGD